MLVRLAIGTVPSLRCVGKSGAMIAAANLTQYPEKRASSFQVSVPCFPKDLNLQAKEPHEIRNDTIRLLVARLCLDCVGCRLGRKTTVDYCLRPGKRSSALDSLYLREHLSTTRRWLDAMWGLWAWE